MTEKFNPTPKAEKPAPAASPRPGAEVKGSGMGYWSPEARQARAQQHQTNLDMKKSPYAHEIAWHTRLEATPEVQIFIAKHK